MSFSIHHGSALTVLQNMAAESVQCCVTSPPYFGLRDYGVSGQIGLERTPAEYVEKLVQVFREVRRVLRNDGTLWLNLGDSYNNCDKWGGGGVNTGKHTKDPDGNIPSWMGVRRKRPSIRGLKPKDLIGIPWRVAFALQADGWYLRSDIIWHKPNPMPESVTDRPTKSHEYVFLLSKSERYCYDADAIKEPASDTGRVNGRDGRIEPSESRPPGSNPRTLKRIDYTALGRNKRTVWTIPTLSTPDAHFATFPIEIPETCILAGCPVGGVVLDHFAGSGTTGLAALKHGRRFVGIDINADYIQIANRRFERHYPLLAGISQAAV